MAQRALYLAAYDIADPNRLQTALRVLKNYASGGQKSVFECYLNAAERVALVAEIRSVLDLVEDRFLLLPLDGRRAVEVLGIAVAPADPAFYYIA